MNKLLRLTVIKVLLLFCTTAQTADLMEVYARAEANDPLFRQAQAAYEAALEEKPQARAQLMPLISLNANTFSHDQEISTQSFSVGDREVGFNTHGYSLDISQPVFHFDRFLALKQADSVILKVQADMDAAHQELMVRSADRYFQVLAAMDNLDFARAEKTALAQQLEQAQQRFEAGLVAITDVQEAQAGYDRAVASEILALNLLDNSRESVREVTGEYFQELAALGGNMELVSPQPDVIEDWTAKSQDQNLRVIASKHALATAEQSIRIERSGHLPTLDIVASKDFNSGGGRFGGTQIHDTAVGLQLNVPLFQGGLVNSRTRQARASYDQAREQLEQEYRSAQRLTREAFLGVLSGISQVRALQQSVVSSETALEATVAGFEAGTRTSVDVVDAQRSLIQARRDLSRARYDYLLNTLRLKQAAGSLSPADLEHINNWLEGSGRLSSVN